MAQEVRSRRQASIPITAFGQKSVQPLGRGMIYRELMLQWAGSFTYGAAANNAAATLGRGDEWSAFSRIDLIANGTDVLRSFSGTQLKAMNRNLYGQLPRPSLTLGDGATVQPFFSSVLTVPLWQPLAAKPMDTALDSSKLSDLRLEVTSNSSAGINSANGPTLIGGTLDICSLESFGVQSEFSECRMYPIIATSAGANAQFQVQLPVTSLYRGFLINTANGSSEPSADLPNACTNVKLISGTTVFRDIPWTVLRDWQRMRLGWARDFVQNAAAAAPISNTNAVYMNGGKSINYGEDSWVFLDLVHDGYLGEGVDAVGFSELYLELNLAAGATVTVVPIQIFPRRKPAAPPA